MREPGSDGNLNVMFFKNFQIICLMSLLTKGKEGLLSGASFIILHFSSSFPGFWVHGPVISVCFLLGEIVEPVISDQCLDQFFCVCK